MAYIDSEHLKAWIEEGKASVAGTSLCRQFHAYLLSLRWLPSRVDWNNLEFEELDLESADEAALVQLAASTRIARHNAVMVMYTPDEPGIICDFELAITNLDYLYWKASGYRYLCGADMGVKGVSLFPEDFAETDGMRLRMSL